MFLGFHALKVKGRGFFIENLGTLWWIYVY